MPRLDEDPALHLMTLVSNDSTIALGQSSLSMEFEDHQLNSKVDLITTTLGSKPPTLPLREERQSLGVETVYKAKGVGWQGVRKKYKAEKEKEEKLKSHPPIGCSHVFSWGACGGGDLAAAIDSFDDDDDDSLIEIDRKNSHSTKRPHAYVTADKKAFKALTYEEYLEYLRKCQEKINREKYLELEVHPDLQESSFRRQRMFTSYFEDTRDDRFGICCQSNQELRDFPSPMHSVSTTSILSEDKVEEPAPIGPLPLVKQRKVSFSDIHHVKTIPARLGQDKAEDGDRNSQKSEDKDAIKTELLNDIDVVIHKIKSSRLRDVDAKKKSDNDAKISSHVKKAVNNVKLTKSQTAGPTKATESRTDNDIMKSTPRKIDEVSPRSRVQEIRNSNLLDRMYLRDEPLSSPNRKDRTSIQSTKPSGRGIQTSPSPRNERLNNVRTLKPVSDIKPNDRRNQTTPSPSKNDQSIIKSPKLESDSKPSGKGTQTSPGPSRNKQANIRSPNKLFSDTKPTNRRNQTSSSPSTKSSGRRTPSSPSPRNKRTSITVTDAKSSYSASKSTPVKTARKISPLKNGAAADLARLLLADIEKISSSSKENNTEIITRPKPLTTFDHSYREDKGVDVLKVDPLLCEEREKRKLSSIDLARKMLDEVQMSLDEEEKAITTSSSLDSADSKQNATLSSSILKEIIESCCQVETTELNAHVDETNVNSEIVEDRTKRKVESISLAKLILNDIKSTLDEEEIAISSPSSRSIMNECKSGKTYQTLEKSENQDAPYKPTRVQQSTKESKVEVGGLNETFQIKEDEEAELSSSSFDIPSTNVFLKQQLDDDNSSITTSTIRCTPITNHPTELAKRRAQDTRDRHKDIDDISRTTSQETEDSWSQPQNIHGLNNGDQIDWVEDNDESVSISSIEKTASASAELARKIIEEATLRHKNIAEKVKVKTNVNLEDTFTSIDDTCDNSSEVDKVGTTKNPSISSEQETVTVDTISLDDDQNKPSRERSEIVAVHVSDGQNHEEIKVSEGEASVEKSSEEAKLQSSQSIEESVQSEESAQSEESETSSSYTDDSIDDLSQDDQQNVKESTDLAKRLLENAKNRLQEVKFSKPVPSVNQSTASDGELESQQSREENVYRDSSAELAKRLLREAFSQNQGALHYQKESNCVSTSAKSITSPDDEDEDESIQQSLQVTRQIMDEAGFSDLFSSSAEEGLFEKIIRTKEEDSIKEEDYDQCFTHFERSGLDSIKEEDDTMERSRNIQDKLSSPSSSHLSNNFLQSKSKKLRSPHDNTPNSKASSDASFKTCVSTPSKFKNIVEKRNDDETLETERRFMDNNSRKDEIEDSVKVYKPSSTSKIENLEQIKKQSEPEPPTQVPTSPQYNENKADNNDSITDDNDDDSVNNKSNQNRANIIRYQIPQSNSMTSYDSSCSYNGGFSIKSTKSMEEKNNDTTSNPSFEIEDPISFTVNELMRINSMLGDAESSCHSSYASGDGTRNDILYYAKQSKEEIAALARAIENQVKAEEEYISFDYDEEDGEDDNLSYDAEDGDNILLDDATSTGSTGTGSSSYARMKRRVVCRLRRDRVAKSPAMDKLIEDVNELCNQIESRIDNIVNDTQN